MGGKMKEVYTSLYKCASTSSDVLATKEKTKGLTKDMAVGDITKISGIKVKETAGLMKGRVILH